HHEKRQHVTTRGERAFLRVCPRQCLLNRHRAPSSRQYSLENEEEDNGQQRTNRYGDEPRCEDPPYDLEINCIDTARHPHAEYRADQGMRRRYRQPGPGRDDDGRRRRKFCCKPAARCQVGNLLADRCDDMMAQRGQADDDADSAEHQHPERKLGATADDTALSDGDHGSDWAYGVRYVVRPMRKGHGAGCYDHQHAEHPLYSLEVLLLVQLAYGLDASYGNAADGRNRHGNPGSDQVAHAAAEIEPDVLQALQYRHQGYCEGGKKNVVRDVALRFCERVLLPENQPLNAAEYQVSDNP